MNVWYVHDDKAHFTCESCRVYYMSSGCTKGMRVTVFNRTRHVQMVFKYQHGWVGLYTYVGKLLYVFVAYGVI